MDVVMSTLEAVETEISVLLLLVGAPMQDRVADHLDAEGVVATTGRCSGLRELFGEDDLLELLVEDHGLGLVDVRNVEYPDSLKKTLDTKACWATLTVPFDHLEDTTYLASAYYLSPAARTYWEEKLDGHVVWFASTVESLTDFLEKFESSVVAAATN